MATVMAGTLKAATLVETIVAVVIILTVFGIATTVIVQTTARGTAMRELKAETVLDEYVLNTHEQMELFDQEMYAGDFTVRRQVTDYKNRPGVKRISYKIYNDSQLLLESRNELFPAH